MAGNASPMPLRSPLPPNGRILPALRILEDPVPGQIWSEQRHHRRCTILPLRTQFGIIGTQPPILPPYGGRLPLGDFLFLLNTSPVAHLRPLQTIETGHLDSSVLPLAPCGSLPSRLRCYDLCTTPNLRGKHTEDCHTASGTPRGSSVELSPGQSLPATARSPRQDNICGSHGRVPSISI